MYCNVAGEARHYTLAASVCRLYMITRANWLRIFFLVVLACYTAEW
jgi:hypothetical protein